MSENESYRLIVTTETMDRKGRPQTTRETIRHIPAGQLDARRATARASAPKGASRTIKVVQES
jgi:hypothetical protein